MTIRLRFKDNNIGKYKGDVLILHGDADNIVPLSYSRQALTLYENADLVVFPREGHGFSPAGSETARVKLLEFIQTK